MRRSVALLTVGLGLVGVWLVGDFSVASPAKFRQSLHARQVLPLARPTQPTERVELGRVLFFDKVLSGNRDVACATCHSARLGSGDASAVSIGTGGSGLGPQRQLGRGKLIARNSLPLFNRGDPQWHSFFWDGRAERTADGKFSSPLGQDLPPELGSLLAAQAIFPLSNRNEMRGKLGDKDVFGTPNDLAPFETSKHSPEFWQRLLERVLVFEEYRRLFAKAYPEAHGHFSIAHLLNALAAYETVTFTTSRAPFARFLAGDTQALAGDGLAGARLFYGKANCDGCHSGSLLTDQRFHNLAVPQVGPGGECINCHAETVSHKSKILQLGETPDHRHVRPTADNQIASNIDFGRFTSTGKQSDRFSFRTPSLWNVARTAPYMHNGCYSQLEQVVRHHLHPAASLNAYQPEGLDPRIAKMVMRDKVVAGVMISRLDPRLKSVVELSDQEVSRLVAFLHALSEPDSDQYAAPQRVPSGLKEDN